MRLPRARVAHAGRGRLRLRIPDKRGDAAYFAGVRGALSDVDGIRAVEVNSATASVLVAGEHVHPEAVFEAAGALGLFLAEDRPLPPPRRHVVSAAMERQMLEADALLRRATGNEAGLRLFGSLVFLATGFVQLYRRPAVPPWYTALWYAYLLGSGAVAEDRELDSREARQDDDADDASQGSSHDAANGAPDAPTDAATDAD